MHKRKLSKVLIFFVAVILSAAILFILNHMSEKTIEVDLQNHEEITEAEMLETFKTDYGWTALTDQKLFWDEEQHQVVINYYFEKNAEEWQIDSAMEYGLKTFVFKQCLHIMSPQIYQVWSNEKEISEVVIQAYEKDNMIRQDIYSGIENGIVHEESHFQNK